MRVKRFTVAMSLLALAAGASEAGTERIAVHGSNTIGAELMPALVKAYAEEELHATGIEKRAGSVPEEVTFIATDGTSGVAPILEAEIHSHGSSTAFRSLQTGQAVIGMASRPIKNQEQQDLVSAGLGDFRAYGSEHVLGLDGLAVIVNPENPVAALSLETIGRIFAGQITDWSQVGPGSGPIAVHARDDKAGTYDTFKSLVLEPAKVTLRSDAKRYESNKKLSDAVAQDSNAIGFTGFAYIGNSKPLALLASCGLAFSPTPYLVKTEEYPLARRLFLYTDGKPANSHAAGLLNYALSDAAQPVIADAGFINQQIVLRPFEEQGQRLAAAVVEPEIDVADLRKLIEKLRLAERASATFRFDSGSADLDNKAKADIGRLARFLKSPAFAGREVLLIGFADSVGDPQENRVLGMQRAHKVAEALAADGLWIPADRVSSFGETAPCACNDNEQGREINRRVEVWLR